MEKYKNITLAELKNLSSSQLDELSKEIREFIIDTVAKNGGHLASNLGIVDATIALHRVFDSPKDKIIFDVGHQCYAHKILTARDKSFDTIRKYKGLSGFSNPRESEHDAFYEGHCGTSLSSALGIAEANSLHGKNDYTIAVVGDGALTNGMIYEALNNCAGKKLNLIILINDNEMSISENVGGLHRYLSTIRTSKKYFKFKRGFEGVLTHIPLIGKPLASFFRGIKNLIKKCFVKNNLFEDMGLLYLGPVDGNNIEKLSVLLEEAKTKHLPCVVHMTTKKGLGYAFAENSPEIYHSVSPFDKEKGVEISNNEIFSNIVGDYVCECAIKDNTICAITAAMCDGTGLGNFAKTHPKNFFDVGIAEEHAVTFASGLSKSGMKPILFLYSTFAQRVYDQIFHDISIQNLPMVLALDRAGIVAGDGITHQGIFDYALFSSLPNTVIYSPESYEDAKIAIDKALETNSLCIVRYPKGKENVEYEKEMEFLLDSSKQYSYTKDTTVADVVIVTYGRISYQAYKALEILKDKYSTGIIKLKQICPLNMEKIQELTQSAKLVYVLEEGIKNGGVGEKIASYYASSKSTSRVFVNAIENYIQHGSLDELMDENSLTAEHVANDISELMKDI